MKAFVCFAAFLAVASAARCPAGEPIAPFEVQNFTGTWYQQYSINTLIFQGSGRCAKAEYTLNPDNDIITVVNSQKTIFGGDVVVEGSAVLADPNLGEGKFLVTLDSLLGETVSELVVWDTDYTNYTILWSCQDVFTFPYVSAWTLTREEILSDEVDQLIQDAWQNVEANGGPRQRLWKPTSQENCF